MGPAKKHQCSKLTRLANKYHGQSRSVHLLALACQAAVTQLLKLTPKISCFHRARGQNAVWWGRHHGFGEGVSLLEPWLVLVAEKHGS